MPEKLRPQQSQEPIINEPPAFSPQEMERIKRHVYERQVERSSQAGNFPTSGFMNLRFN